MTDRFSEDEVITIITRLTRQRLVTFIEADFVKPHQHDTGYQFRQIDIARLELLCDLCDDLELNETAIAVVLSLIDQLHAARQERATVTRALNTLPDDLRARIVAALALS